MLTYSLLGLTAGLAALYLFRISRGQVQSSSSEPQAILDRRPGWARHRGTFLNVGIVFALGFVTLAFNYETTRLTYSDAAALNLDPLLEIEVVPPTAFPPTAPPPPPPPTPVVHFDPSAEIELVEDLPETLEPVMQPIAAATPSADAMPTYVAPPPPPAPPAPPAPASAPNEIFRVVEQMPAFQACAAANMPEESDATKALLQFIASSIKYPAIARENGVQGTAVVSFVVERDGSITNAQIVRDPGAGTGAEALRVVNAMCPWTPGKQRGNAVRVQFNLPVKFRLN